MYSNLAAIEMLRGNSNSAEQAFKRAIEIDPNSIGRGFPSRPLPRQWG